MKKIICFMLFIQFIFADKKADQDYYQKIEKTFDFVFDKTYDDALPDKFRSAGGPYLKNVTKSDKEILDDLRISGSRQFSKNQLKALLQYLSCHKNVSNDKIFIIDLREEAHFFTNDQSIVLIDKKAKKEEKKFDPFMGITATTIEAFEKNMVERLRTEKKKTISILNKKKFFQKKQVVTVDSENAQTERAIVECLGANYKRFSVTDHKRPTDALIDDFIAFYQSLPRDAWLHFHCRGGAGRTSSFMIMIDILKNAKKDSLDKIIERNIQMGNSKKLFDISQIPSKKLHDGIVRRDFLLKFYEYAKTAYGEKTWSDWVQKK